MAKRAGRSNPPALVQASFRHLISVGFVQKLLRQCTLISVSHPCKLMRLKFHSRSPCFWQGCGYPVRVIGLTRMQKERLTLCTQDFATRHMVKHLSTRCPQMPIFAVMDNDPYGLDIFSVYKWGSLVKCHNVPFSAFHPHMLSLSLQAQAHDSVNLTIPTIQFLGIGCDDMTTLVLPSPSLIRAHPH